MKLNVLTHNGFIYIRLKETSDRIFWKCALSTTDKCTATHVTNKMLRVIDNDKNQHSHDKGAYETLKRSMQQSRKRRWKIFCAFSWSIKIVFLSWTFVNDYSKTLLKWFYDVKLIKFSFYRFADNVKIDYFETPRGAKGILCQGFYFVKEKAFGKTINWHCMFKKKHGCGARGITNFSDPMVMRVTKKIHSHDIEEKNFTILPISALFKWTF